MYPLVNNEWLAEGSLEVKLPTIWTDEKQSRAEAERREHIRREKSRRERVRRKKHISKSECTKHLSVGPLLEVAMPKKCTQIDR